MPIKTTYKIYNSHHRAPQYSTSDKALAYAEYMALIRKGGDVYRLVQTPMADGALTKAEEYLMLVYRVRKLMRQYFDRGRRKEDLMASLELQQFLAQGRYNEIVIHRNDKRLELCDDNDKFLAMLADCDKRDVLLFSGRCRSLFGGSVYHWRNIARKCPITAVASAVSECGSGYYGRGWEIAPHICTLRKWIIEHIEEYKSLKV